MPSYSPNLGKPHLGSLANKVREFFANNPDEMLTFGDIAIKFGCTVGQARSAVAYLRSRDVLSTMHVVCASSKSDRPPRCDE